MSKEAMKLALEALDRLVDDEPAQQEPEYKGWYCAHCQRGVDGSEVTYHEQHTVCGRVITDDVPPKAQQQELCPSCKNGDIYACTCTFKSAQRQESVGEIGKIVMFDGDLKEVSWKNGNMPPVGSILYTSPPASKPLSNEKIGQAARDAHIAFCLNKHQTYEHALTRAIEAAHGIKEKNT